MVLAGDLEAGPRSRRALEEADLIVAADGGAERLRGLGAWPHVVIGDMDSLDPALARDLEARSVQMLAHPARKDQTDSELAMLEAVRRGAAAITVLGALGGQRWDHALANALLPAHPALAQCSVRLLNEASEIFFLRQGERVLDVDRGDLVSLIPLTETVQGVTAAGLEWPLTEATLRIGSTLTVSNVATADRVKVLVKSGALLLIHFFGANAS